MATAIHAKPKDMGPEPTRTTKCAESEKAGALTHETAEHVKGHYSEKMVTIFAVGVLLGGALGWIMSRSWYLLDSSSCAEAASSVGGLP